MSLEATNKTFFVLLAIKDIKSTDDQSSKDPF